VIDGYSLQGVGDGTGQVLCVFGPALQNDADRNDHVRFLL
jgi:hypothetical protein